MCEFQDKAVDPSHFHTQPRKAKQTEKQIHSVSQLTSKAQVTTLEFGVSGSLFLDVCVCVCVCVGARLQASVLLTSSTSLPATSHHASPRPGYLLQGPPGPEHHVGGHI